VAGWAASIAAHVEREADADKQTRADSIDLSAVRPYLAAFPKPFLR
jgi:hypothetical protein